MGLQRSTIMVYCNQSSYKIITIESFFKTFFKPTVNTLITGQLTEDKIIKIVCMHFKITEIDIKRKSHKWDFSDPRAIAMSVIKKYLKISLERIGKLFNNRNHSTVIFSLKKVEALIKTDKKFNYDYTTICTYIETYF